MMVQFDVKRVSNGTESFMVSFDFAKTPITQVADYIIIAASKNKTSDIHFDPREDGMMVRFRIDGDCQDYTFIPKAYEKNLTTRLKLLANMNITETRLPQDGAIKGEFGGTYMDMRVACLPTNQGEKIVIRILDYTRSLQGIDSLGFHPKNLEKIKRMMMVPNGIILVTGATGSGKSTTTYSMLSALNKPEINVITVEDPVEMNIEGINQVQVNAEIGMTFAAALRSILREDPNVILIGEIRDSETAQIAVRASITGHLVMSTLHTNNALATIERLVDMDVERYLLSTALTGIVSQRLAKQLCPDCRYQREATPYEKKVFKKFLHKDVSMVWDANPKGCDNCRKGYRGRIAVHEVLELDDHIRSAVNDEKLSKEDLAKMIYNGKTITMLQDALIKALNGETSFEEVYRTIEIENEDEDNYAQEISEVTDQKAEEEEALNLPTGDDLLEDEANSTTPLIPALNIPELNQQPTETAEETTESNGIIPAIVQPEPPEQAQDATIPTTTIEHLTETTPVTQEQPTEQQNTVPAATIGPDGQLIIPVGASENTMPVEEEKPLPPATEQLQMNGIVQAQTQQPEQALPTTQPLIPTVEIQEEKAPDPMGYKIVMPTEEPQQPEIPQPEQVQPLEQQPLAPTTPEVPIQQEYKVSSNILDDDTTTPVAPIPGGAFLPSVQEIVTAPAPTQVQQLESPIYAPTKTDENYIPSFDVKTNPTELANQLMQIAPPPVQQTTAQPVQQQTAQQQSYVPVINESPVDGPIPRIQAVSILPGMSEETQQLTTGSQVLNDPGIRIAESPTPYIPTIEQPQTVEQPQQPSYIPTIV